MFATSSVSSHVHRCRPAEEDSLRFVARERRSDDGKRRAIVFAEYFPPYMSSDRRLFHLVSNLQDWSVSAIVTPPLRVLTKRCEHRLLPYGRSFTGVERVRTHGGIAATYLTLPGWLRRMFERTATLPLAYAASIPLLIARAAKLVRDWDPDLCVVGHPSFITGVVGVAAAKLCGKPVLLDYPDAWTALAVETSGLHNRAAIATLKNIEAAVARAADRIVRCGARSLQACLRCATVQIRHPSFQSAIRWPAGAVVRRARDDGARRRSRQAGGVERRVPFHRRRWRRYQ